MRRTIAVAAALSMLVWSPAFSQEKRDKVDRIVAVVGSSPILASEVAQALQLSALQTGKRPTNQQELEKMQKDVIEQMISEQLFLIEANKDTTITVRAEEVDQALDEQVGRIAARYGSNEAFMQALSAEGLTLRDLKKKYRSDIENQLKKQRLIQSKLANVSVSRHEVETFYQKFKDSIPDQPEGVKLAHVLLNIKASPTVEDSVKALANQLRQRILEGADFAAISAQYSGMGAGVNGGDLGYVSKEDVVAEFARAAFALSAGEISGVVRTQFGYHIIKCEGKRDDKLRLRHVLLPVTPSAADSARTYQLADSLLAAAKAGADFADMAKTFSEDNNSRAQGGELGWFSLTDLPSDFSSAVAGWKTAGEYKGPVKSQYGLHILKLLDYQPAKKYTLEGDYDKIKELARQDKTARLVDKWLAQIRAKTYVEYRLENS